MRSRTTTTTILLFWIDLISSRLVSAASAAFVTRATFRRFSSTRTTNSFDGSLATSLSSVVVKEEIWDDAFSLNQNDNEERLQPSTLRKVTFRDLSKAQQPQLLCDFLMEIGACSTSITDAHRDTPNEVPIFREFDDDDDDDWIVRDYNSDNHDNTNAAAAVVCGDAAVRTNVWNTCHVSALFPASKDLAWVADLVQSALDIPLLTQQGGFNVSEVPDMDWVVHVQQSWKPIVVNNVILKFPWHTPQDVEEAVQQSALNGNNDGVVQLDLQGGIAFGTGEHATTQLCLGWIQRHVGSMERLMDYGCGSGILGMAACKLAATRDDNDKACLHTVVGVDLDVDAVGIANANARINQVDMTNYLPPQEAFENDLESESVFLVKNAQGEQTLPPHLNRPVYDALVANILAGPLVKLAPTLAGLLRKKPTSSSQMSKGGILGLSGVLKHRASKVIKAYEPYFDDVGIEEEKEGWVLITGTRNGRDVIKR